MWQATDDPDSGPGKCSPVRATIPLGAIFDLNGPAEYLSWHFIQISVPNFIVIVLMVVVFVAALLVPFPKREREP